MNGWAGEEGKCDSQDYEMDNPSRQLKLERTNLPSSFLFNGRVGQLDPSVRSLRTFHPCGSQIVHPKGLDQRPILGISILP